jgi:hypothetical protein
MSDDVSGRQGSSRRPPHAATVVQPKPRHPATVQPMLRRPATPPKTPHPATVLLAKGLPAHAATVAQPMLWKGIKSVATSVFTGVLNPLELPEFTSCLCLVFNTTDESTLLDTLLYRTILSGMKGTWDNHHAPNTFHYLCPYNQDHEFTSNMRAAMRLDLGERPLIVVTGHSSPGSNSISCDGSVDRFKVQEVFDAVAPFMTGVFTVFLSACSTAERNDQNKPSFQERFDAIVGAERPCFSIGTSSTSVPLFGKVHAEGLTFTFKGVPLDQQDFLGQLRAYTL